MGEWGRDNVGKGYSDIVGTGNVSINVIDFCLFLLLAFFITLD